MVKLLYLAYMYGHLLKVVCCEVGWSIEAILYPPFLGIRAIWPIMQSLALAFSMQPLDFLSGTCGLGEMIKISKIMMNLFSIWNHMS